MNLSAPETIWLVIIGLLAGGLGGMLGIGGSIIMIPAMAIIFHNKPWGDQHLYQAAAMVVNVAVALPAAIRHNRAGAIRADLFRIMFPAALVAIVAGVFISNLFDADGLKAIFALFLFYVVIDSAIKLIGKKPEHQPEAARINFLTGGIVGTVMGFLAGLLGIGGGGIAVPLANVICRVPLRQAIGVSAAVMCLTAGVGATIKIITISQHSSHHWTGPVILAVILSPTAVMGGYLGASLTHRAPVRAIRAVFTVVLTLAALRMAGIL